MKIKLQPFRTPNFVLMEMPPGRRQDGLQENKTFPLKDLEPDELSAMCNAFRAECFKKAGMNDPDLSEES